MLRSLYRLTREQDFRRVYRQGRKASSPNFTIFFLNNSQGVSRFGFVVSKFEVQKIVERNRLKRIIRAVIGSMLPHISTGFDFAVKPRASLLLRDGEQIKQELKELFQTARLWKNH